MSFCRVTNDLSVRIFHALQVLPPTRPHTQILHALQPLPGHLSHQLSYWQLDDSYRQLTTNIDNDSSGHDSGSLTAVNSLSDS